MALSRLVHRLLPCYYCPLIQEGKRRNIIIVRLLLLFFLVTVCSSNNNNNDNNAVAPLTDWEEERMAEYHKRNYTWPIPQYVPQTLGWRKLMDHRFRQAAEIEDSQHRYEAYAQTVSAALVQPNFTRYGFGLARAPEPLMVELRQAIHDGLATGTPREELGSEVIEGPNKPWFIDRPDLTTRVSNNDYSSQLAGVCGRVVTYSVSTVKRGMALVRPLEKCVFDFLACFVGHAIQ
jgi:hypothetical protein